MMCKPGEKYPGFHKIEIIAELEKSAGGKTGLSVVEEVGDERIRAQDYLEHLISQSLYTPDTVLIRKLSENSMVVSFYGNRKLSYSMKCLRQIDQLQYIVSASGGQFTVVESADINTYPESNTSGCTLNLHFYFDPADLVARGYHICSNDADETNIHFGKRGRIVNLANLIIDSFYKVVFSQIDIGRGAFSRYPSLRYA